MNQFESEAEASVGTELPPLVTLFEEQAIRTPDAVALECGNEALTYRELDTRASRLARFLRGRGVAADSCVAISIGRSRELIVAVLGVLKAGGACVPVDPAYPASRRQYMIADCGARWLLTHAGTRSDAAGLALEVIDLDADWPRISAAQPDPAREDAPQENATAASLAYIIYTSGSTGKPKGVELPQRALVNLIQWQVARPDFRADARVLQFSSLSFDVSFQETFSTWASGGTLVMIDDLVRRDPRALLDWVIDRRIGRIFFPYVALRGLAEAAVTSGRLPESLREIYTAGEQLQVDATLRQFFKKVPACLLENQYGPSETHVATAHRLTGSPDQWPALPPIGEPVANAQVCILDATRHPVSAGEPGEIYIGGICLARGYRGKPELTAERFVSVTLPEAGEVRLYRTGDLGRQGDDGTLFFDGRIDHQVKFRGYRVEPGEIAAAIGDHPSIAQCVAAVRDSGAHGQRLVAYVLPRTGAEFSQEVLHVFAREHLPQYMVPSHIVVVESFPLTPSGKIDMKSLPEPAFDRRALSTEYLAPRTPDELALARIWSRVLGVATVGIKDDFFDLGGDSIQAIGLTAAIRDELGIDLTLGSLTSHPTIESLAKSLRGEGNGAQWRSLVPIQTGGAKTPLFFVHGGAANVASFPLLARQLPADQPFYALQWDGLTGSDGQESIETMAASYLREVRSVQPNGPYLLGGLCIGGLVAVEMGRLLQAAGERVAHLVMLDSPHLQSPRYRKSRRASALLKFLRSKKDRRAKVEIWVRRLLRLPQRPEHRRVYTVPAMIRAAGRFRVPRLEAPATLVATGLGDGRYLGLSGSWDDAAMGWTAFAGDALEIQHVSAEHSEVLFEPGTAEIISRILEKAHGQPRSR